MDDVLTKEVLRLIELKDEINRLKSQLSEKQRDFEAQEKKVFTLMLNYDIQSINIEGKTVYRTIGNYPRIKDEDAFFEYLRESGQESLIKETVHPTTLRSWFNELMENNPEEAERLMGSVLEVYQKEQVRIRRA